LLTLAADASAFAALGGQDVGVAGVGVAPAQVLLQPAGQDSVIGGRLESPMTKVRTGGLRGHVRYETGSGRHPEGLTAQQEG
jgi:hypothetical protein